MSLIDYPYSRLISQRLRGAITVLSTESARRCERPVPRVPRAQSRTSTPVSRQQALQHHPLKGGDLRGLGQMTKTHGE